MINAKCDTSSNDTSSNEPFRLKVTSSKWLFVECTHCRKMISSNSFDENISWLIVNKLVAMLLCWSCAHHMTAGNEYGQCRRWPNLNMVRIFYSAVPVGSFVNKTSEKKRFYSEQNIYTWKIISISIYQYFVFHLNHVTINMSIIWSLQSRIQNVFPIQTQETQLRTKDLPHLVFQIHCNTAQIL